MFGLGSGDMGSLGYPPVYRPSSSRRKMSKRDMTPPTITLTSNAAAASSKHHTYPSATEYFEPAIDGPPSPGHIRAYTEHMRRGSAVVNKSSTPSFTSTSSFRSRQSSLDSSSQINLQRNLSQKSNSSSMATKERPDSLNLFGKSLFSRSSKKFRRYHGSMGSSSSSSLVKEGRNSPEFAAGGHSPPPANSRLRKNTISGPYNFQHLTHTAQEQVPELKNIPPMKLVTEFSTLRTSQAPTNGGLKGIRARDLMFENFSSVALDHVPDAPSSPTSPTNSRRPTTPQRRGVLRKSLSPPQQTWRAINYSVSHDNLRSPPVRPPRSPPSPHCPIQPPARVSSRTASTFFNTIDPMSVVPAGLQESTPFDFTHEAQSPPSPPKWNSEFEFSDKHMSHAVTTPGDEAWPLSAPLGSDFGGDLADVPEEEEHGGRRRSRTSVSSGELRMSKSVPGLRTRALEQAPELPEMGSYFARAGSNDTTRLPRFSITPNHQMFSDSWEDDIDYCYEHEAEANCDYDWDRRSTVEHANSPKIPAAKAAQNENTVSPTRFRPSLLVPAPFDLPELSPLSGISSASSYLRTPTNFMAGQRPTSYASTFKESDGFNLSPTLLIPGDDYHQSEHDALFDTYHHDHVPSATIFPMDSYDQPSSPVDETLSSTMSYRSSVYSHNSLRSSSSTRYNRSSQDSALLVYQAGNMSKAHRSIGSASSLPDLVPSALRSKRESRTLPTTISDPELITQSVASLKIQEDEPVEPAPAPAPQSHPIVHHPRKSKSINHFPPPQSLSTLVSDSHAAPSSSILSPVAESFTDSPPRAEMKSSFMRALQTPVSVESVISNHGRKISAPIDSIMAASGSSPKTRSRSNTAGTTAGKRRGSYMLFPLPPA
ncbi:pak-box p21-rho-binding protein [Rutstroemia sp. NJR-2017a WRK4]|nr:pak-box p21-rho-binding protein [Rutstroemia sp. NJR-2017a WRK4]